MCVCACACVFDCLCGRECFGGSFRLASLLHLMCVCELKMHMVYLIDNSVLTGSEECTGISLRIPLGRARELQGTGNHSMHSVLSRIVLMYYKSV